MDVRQVPELESALLTRSLDDPELAVATAAAPEHRILPDAHVIKVGGQSFIDRGREAVYPLIEELARGRRSTAADRHRRRYPRPTRLLAGRRAGLPTGVLPTSATPSPGRTRRCWAT